MADDPVLDPAIDRSRWLSHDAYLSSFRSDAARLAMLARDLPADAPVPTCPGWTLLDLVRHVGDVYAHKAAVLRLGRRPEQGEWPLGDDLDLPAALDRHDAVVDELAGLLAERGADSEVWTWMEGPGAGTSGAWARRMAHEALVHRVDAEAAAGKAPLPAAAGLAADGVVEVLTWMADDPDVLADDAGLAGGPCSLLVDWGDGALLLDLPDGGYRVRLAEPGSPADARLFGDPQALDLELWGRLEALPDLLRGDLDVVETFGDPQVVERLRSRVRAATQ